MEGKGCRLLLRVNDYELPKARDFDDGNWLTGEVELKAGLTGAFSARQRVALRADDLERFRADLRRVVESLSGSAILDHLEGQLGCSVVLERGRGSLTAFVKEHVGSELRVRDCETDQSYVGQTLRDLDAVMDAFPVRGKRP